MKGFRYPGAARVQEVPEDKYVLEEIWWWDHYHGGEWESVSASQDKLDSPPFLMRTIGWVIAENAGQVMLAQTMSQYDDGTVQGTSNRWCIIKECIEKRWELQG